MRNLLRRRTTTFWVMAAFFTVSLVFRVWASEPTWGLWDENYYLNIAQSFAARGELTPYMWRLGPTNIISGSGTGYGLILQNGWLTAVGGSLFWGRLLMVGCALAAAALMYWVARAWWNSPEAGAAALIVALVAPSAFYTMAIRMDAIPILVYVPNLWLHLYAVRSSKKWPHFVLGLSVIVSLEFHVFGLFLAAAFALYYGIDYVRLLLRERRIVPNAPAVYYGAGLLIAAGGFYIVHILPDPETYFLFSRLCDECGEGAIAGLPKRVMRYILLRPFETLVLIAAMVSVLRRRTAAGWHYVTVLAGWLIAEAIIGPPPNPVYYNHRWPLIALGAGAIFTGSGSGGLHRVLRQVGLMLAAILLGLNLYMHLTNQRPVWDAENWKDTPGIAYIQAHVPTDTVIMARADKFSRMQEYTNFLSYRDTGIRVYMAIWGKTALEFWKTYAPPVVFLEDKFIDEDEEVQQFLREGGFREVFPEVWVAEGFTLK